MSASSVDAGTRAFRLPWHERGKNDASTDISRCSAGPFEVRTTVKTMPVNRKGRSKCCNQEKWKGGMILHAISIPYRVIHRRAMASPPDKKPMRKGRDGDGSSRANLRGFGQTSMPG